MGKGEERPSPDLCNKATIKHKKLKSKNTEWESLVSTDLDRQLWPEDDDPEF